MAAVKVLRPPINSDPAAEVPRRQWNELLLARRDFCEERLPHDCRLLLFFIQDAAANNWLDLGGREEYIRALKLDSKMVEWALEGLKATRPDVAVTFADAVTAGLRAKPGRPSEAERNANPISIRRQHGTSRNYILKKLARDGYTQELAAIKRGETKPKTVAKKLGWIPRTVEIQPTVEGFERAMLRHLDAHQRAELLGRLIMISREDRCDLEDAHAALKERL